MQETDIRDTILATERESGLKTTKKTIGERLAQIYSLIFHPFLVPIYGMLLLLYGPTYLYILPNRFKVYLIVVFALATLLFPAFTIGLFRSLNIIKDLSLSSRRERVIPLMLVAIGYMACLYMTSGYIVLGIFVQLLAGALIVLICCFIINLYWKISLHMAVIGGCTAILLYITQKGYGNMAGALRMTLLVAGLLGTVRLYLGKHNVWQVLAGFTVGMAAMGLGIWIF